MTRPGRRRSFGQRSGVLLLIPGIAYLVLFFLVPVGFIAYYSLGYKPALFGTVATDRLSLDRYKEALGPTFLATFTNTLQIAVIGTLSCLVIGLPVAYWAARHLGPRSRQVVLALILLPFWTNFLIRTVGWVVVLAPGGWLSHLLQAAHLTSHPLDVLDTRGAVQLGVVYNYVVYMILPIYVAFERTDPALREAARDLGATRWRAFRQVTLPQAAAGIAAGLILVFIPLCGDYITATILGGAKGNMVGQLVAGQFLGTQNWALGSAVAMLLVVSVLVVTALLAALAYGTLALLRRRRRVVLVTPTVAVAHA